MTDNPFARPSAGGDKFEPKDFAGALLIVFPKSYNPNESTTFGPSTSADCDIVVVDRPGPDGKPTYKANARLFGNLANSVRDSIGSQVLGRLAQVPTNKGNPAWVLTDVVDNPAEVALAMPALTAYQQGLFKAAAPAGGQQPATSPQQQPATPATAAGGYDPWAGMNAAPAAPAQYAPPPQQQYPAPQYGAPPGVPAQAAQGAPADPHSAFLASRGMDPNAVAAMDPATRQNVAQQLGFTG